MNCERSDAVSESTLIVFRTYLFIILYLLYAFFISNKFILVMKLSLREKCTNTEFSSGSFSSAILFTQCVHLTLFTGSVCLCSYQLVLGFLLAHLYFNLKFAPTSIDLVKYICFTNNSFNFVKVDNMIPELDHKKEVSKIKKLFTEKEI